MNDIMSEYSEYITGILNLASSVSDWMGPSFCDAYCYAPETFEKKVVQDLKLKTMFHYEDSSQTEREVFAELFGDDRKLLEGMEYWIMMKIGDFQKVCTIKDEHQICDRMFRKYNNTRFYTVETIRMLVYEKAILIMVCGNNE